MKAVKIMKKPKSFVFFTASWFSMIFMFCALGLLARQKPPIFRARTDLMQLDVTVLDQKGQPVRGLTKEDFTLLEDNKLQTIEAFSAVDLPDRVAGAPVWESKAVLDVAPHEIDNERIVIIMLDDALGLGLWGKREMKASATKLVESLGPKDLSAVVFTGATYRKDQNLTLDRARLITAINAYPDLDGNLLFPPAPDPGADRRDVRPRPLIGADQGLLCRNRKDLCCMAYKQVFGLMEGVIGHLSTLPNRRKAIIYFGANLPWEADPTGDPCGTYFKWRDVFAAAQLAHVTINPLGQGFPTQEHYLAVAENTGGYAPNSNDFWAGVQRILVENSSYYLLAFQPANREPDGTFRRLTVKVNRKDVEVHTRRGYWAPKPPKPADPAAAPPSEQVEALAGVLPLSELTLRATAAPFGIAGSRDAVLAVSIGVRQPAFLGRTSEQIDLLVKAFTADGDPRGSDEQTIPIVVPAPPATSEHSRYEVLSRLDVPAPGKYELRRAVKSGASDTRGSVYVDVDVPDFGKDKLSMSGVIVNNAVAATPTAPPRLLREVTPLVPTTERTFGSADIVTTLVRIYQGGDDKLVPVALKVSITDAAGKSVFTQNDSVAPERFGTTRSADYQFRVPLAKLQAGQHLLTIEASSGKNTARRDIRFEKK